MAIKPVSVTQFNSYVKRVLQTDPLLGNVSVIGEISNLKYHGSGHVFFTLKDEGSRLSCFLPSEQVMRLHYELTEGMLVTAIGYVSVYERGGTYSLNVRDITVEGTGNLSAAFEALRSRLEKEGLFDPKYKKAIPSFPRQVAIITSETGAAVRDIIKIIRQRNDIVDIILYPCLVQGPDAAVDIASAIDDVNRTFPGTDVIITGRGGGSIEELWAFNEEIVVRSIFLSAIPVISAVGHETDITLADFVSDKRAATPSEAAQISVPDLKVLRAAIESTASDIVSITRRLVRYFVLQTEQYNMDALKKQIEGRVEYAQMKAESLRKDLIYTLTAVLAENKAKIEILQAEIKAVSPYAIMERGYAVLTDENNKLILSAEALKKGDFLTVICKDGKIRCLVEEVRRASYGKEYS